ncbi:pilus assembly protein N-terminal domain-containing protein [Breoghania sp. L-A4]|uniref:pilus assembly protein N-terminal domain-containing protein n=1 Tax=Breoghania sp. L-A4 TaxID=2304600 RepID=UPI000E360860|nr:pilus assembly protein N-terminal domain-containing protein [Breoghania sp. L-A4]AXS42344.1 pilus assembly protein [Breoghania sp. L-A4]
MGSPRFRIALSAGLAAVSLCLAAPASAEGTVSVIVDRAKVFHIEGEAGTIIIGNPSIADVVINDPTTLIITGKSYGTTNLVILDTEGQPIVDEVIVVQAPEGGIVTVQRSGSRFSYNCAPTCQPTLNMGDHDDFFKTTGEQATQHSAIATTSADSGQE